MTVYWVFTASVVFGVAAGAAGCLFVRKRLPAGASAESGDGAMLRTLIDNLPDLIYVKDVDGRFLLADVAVARLMGAKSQSELLGKNDFDFHPKGLATHYHEDEQAVIRSAKPLLA